MVYVKKTINHMCHTIPIHVKCIVVEKNVIRKLVIIYLETLLSFLVRVKIDDIRGH